MPVLIGQPHCDQCSHTAEAQPELGIPVKPEPGAEEIEKFVELLFGLEDWATAGEVLRLLELPVLESNKRKVRDWTQYAKGRVISGQKGYRHTLKGSTEEIAHCRAWLRSQGSKMIHHELEIGRYAHAHLGKK